MHATHLVFFVAALGLMNAPFAQTRDERSPEPRKKPPSPSFPDTVKPKPTPPKASQPGFHQPHSTHSTSPQRTHVERERVHEPRPRPPRASTPERPVAPAVQAQPTRTTATPPQRDVTLARCDELRRRMEQAMRDEARSGDQRRAIYQEQLRAGCI